MKTTILIFILAIINTTMIYSQTNIVHSEQYAKGWKKLQEIDGEAGENVVNGLRDISPELAKFIIEYSFGEVYSLKALDNKSKEIAAVASLITQGAIPQLKVHLHGALNTGSSIVEVKEVILHSSVYVGFPKTINAMNALREVLAERKEKGMTDNVGEQAEINESLSKYELGAKYLSILDENQEQVLQNAYKEFSPELIKFVVEYGYGDVYSRESLDKKYRQIATIAMLTTLGNAQSQLKFHIKAGLNVGLTKDQINEIMLMMTVYAGFPAAINGTNILKEIMEEKK